VHEKHILTLNVEGNQMKAVILDFGGQDAYQNLAYRILEQRFQSDALKIIIIIVVDVSNITSFYNVKTRWIPLIKQVSKSANVKFNSKNCYILGNKIDLRKTMEPKSIVTSKMFTNLNYGKTFEISCYDDVFLLQYIILNLNH
ncbi:MAG: hypothetical protein MHPSP_001589, partial [Paramarteilia canceri]